MCSVNNCHGKLLVILTSTLCLILTASSAIEAQTGSVTLDYIAGLDAQGRIPVDNPVVFYFRYTNNFGNKLNVSNGFRVYSPDGATWSPIVGAHVYDWSSLFALNQISYRSADGSSSDSVAFTGVDIIGTMPLLRQGFSEVMCSIATLVMDPSNIGRHLCLDSSYMEFRAWEWSWSIYSYVPDWDGPHCYEIVEAGQPPLVLCPGGLDTILCDVDSLCFPVSVFGSVDSVKVLPIGDYSPGHVCILADTSGTYTIAVIAFGETSSDTCETTLNVSFGAQPTVTCPADDAVNLCEPETVCYHVNVSSPTFDIESVVVSPYGTYSPVTDEVCFLVDTAGLYSFDVTAFATCGSASDDFNINVQISQPPEITCPGNLDTVACRSEDMCISVPILGEVSQVDVNLGQYLGDQVCFACDTSGVYAIAVYATNSCGVDTCNFEVNVTSVSDICFSSVASATAEVTQVVTADLDLDTYTDVVFLGETGVGLFVAWGQAGNPPIGDPVSVAAIANADIKVFHLNGDLLPDIVAATDSWIYSLLNNGDRTFSVDSVANTSGYRSYGASPEEYGAFPRIALGFFDSDPYPDLVVTPNKLFSGDGSGGFVANAALGFTFETVDVSDFDGDGADDLVVVGSGSATVYLNDGVGSFSASGGLALGLEGFDVAGVIADVDVNGDGLVDMIAAVAQNTGTDDTTVVTVASGDGLGGLILVDTAIVLGTAPQFAVSDVDRDFLPDVVLSDASAGSLVIRYNDGFGGLSDADEVLIGTGGDLRFALASADLDRDGQPDFVSGSAAGGNIVLELNNLPDEPVLSDEMFVTGYDYVEVWVVNPSGYVISRNLQTVAGSEYYRLSVDGDEYLDVRTYDYNLQYGLYKLGARLRPGSGTGAVVSMGIGIDGSYGRTVYSNYTVDAKKIGLGAEQSDEYTFDFEVEEQETMRPFNGFPTDNRSPRFDWRRRVGDPQVGKAYRFELDEYHDFRSPLRFEADSLKGAWYQSPELLGLDSVYYWRYLTSHNNGLTYPDTSLTFAAYISESCCWQRVGNVNGLGEYPGEITLADIMMMVDVLFISNDCGRLMCIEEADVNQSGGLDPSCPDDLTLADIMILVDFLFITGPENSTLLNCL